MGEYAGICPCDDGNARRARDWYSRLNTELAHASHTQITYVDDATPATTANTLIALANARAQLIFYFGHSTSDEWTRKGIATVDRTNVWAAKGKAVVSVSCKSGRNLGPDAVSVGGVKAWLGFTIKVPVIPPYGPDDPTGDAIVKGLAALAFGTMADARATLEAELRQSAIDYDTGGRHHHHPDALIGYFACGWLADNVSLSGDTTLNPLAHPPTLAPKPVAVTRTRQASKNEIKSVISDAGDWLVFDPSNDEVSDVLIEDVVAIARARLRNQGLQADDASIERVVRQLLQSLKST